VQSSRPRSGPPRGSRRYRNRECTGRYLQEVPSRHTKRVAMRVKTILTTLVITVIILFLLAVIGIGALLESHTFRASVSGRVTDTEGHPIAAAKVEFSLPNSDSIQYDQSTTTHSDGRYSIILPQFTAALDSSPCYGRYVNVSADGYIPANRYQKLEKGHNPNCDFALMSASRRIHEGLTENN
jgi:hypothetical protein